MREGGPRGFFRRLALRRRLVRRERLGGRRQGESLTFCQLQDVDLCTIIL